MLISTVTVIIIVIIIITTILLFLLLTVVINIVIVTSGLQVDAGHLCQVVVAEVQGRQRQAVFVISNIITILLLITVVLT